MIDQSRKTSVQETFVLGGALLLIAAIYLRSMFFEFVYDDLAQIVDNPKIKSWALALTYFKSHVWSQGAGLALYYRPLYMLWLRLNLVLFGREPLYWHLIAIALHLTVCVLLYFFARRLSGARWVALFSVLIFGLHPAHVESVAWISGTTESLAACLILGSVLCYWKQRDSTPKVPGLWLAASLLLALSATLVKESAIVIPALIFSYEWIFPGQDTSLKARFREGFRAAVPFAAISVAFLAMRTLALGSLTPPLTKLSRLYTLLAWPADIAFYVVHGLFPHHLSVFYNRLAVSHPGQLNFIFPSLLVLAGSAGLFYGSRRSRVFAFLTMWWIITMIPTLNVTLVNNIENLHDRYLYLPSVTICLALAIVIERLKELGYGKTAWGLLILIAAGYATVTFRELPYWRNDIALAQRGIDVSPGHPIAPQVMGNALIREGRLDAAIPYFVEALDAMPTNVDTLCSLGYCYSEINALRLAEECIGKALAGNPSEPRAHLVLGIIRLKENRLDEAEAEFRRGIALQPVPVGFSVFHYNLGNVLYDKADIKGALREYRIELQNNPASDPAFALAQQRVMQIERLNR